MSSPLSILLELPSGRRGLGLSVFSALARAVGVVLIAEAVVRAIIGHSGPGVWVVLGLLGAGLRGGGLWLDRRLGTGLAAESKQGLRAEILSALLRGRGRPRTATAVTVTRGIDDLDDYFTTVLPALSAAAVVPVVLLVRIVFSDVLSAVIVALCLPLVPLFMVLIGRYTAESTTRTIRALERLSDHLAELAEGLPVLIGLGRSRDHARRLRELGERYHQANLTTLRVAFLSSLALELIATISVALVAVVIGLRLVNGTMDLSSGLFILLIAPECFTPLRELGSGFHASENGREARSRAQTLLNDTEDAAQTEAGSASLRQDSRDGPQRVVYADGTVISWADQFGTGPGVTTVSGRSGTGKTTVLTALIGGLPADAETTVTPISAAYVPQTPRMFAATIGAELELFGLDARGAVRELEAAGLPTDPLTATAALSPGQQRRLALVRVLHRLGDGADALVLDEPTAHLDADNAGIVIDMIAEAAVSHRVILASHDERVRALAETEIRPVRAREAAPNDSGPAVAEGQDSPAVGQPNAATVDARERRRSAGRASSADSAESPAVAADSLWEDGPGAEHVSETKTAALRRRWSILRSSLPLLNPAMVLAALSACASSLAAIALTAVSAWLIVEASYQPPIMLLMVAIVGVRFFGLSRSVLLYASRLKLHSAIFAALTRLRTILWEHFERVGMSDRKLLTSDSALTAMVADADDVRDLVPRTLFPPLVSAMVVLGVCITAALLDLGSLPWFLLLGTLNLIVLASIVISAESKLARGVRDDRNRILSVLTRALNAKDDVHVNGADSRVLGLLSRMEIDLEAKQTASARNFGLAHLWLQLSTVGTALVLAATSSAPTEILAVLALMAVGLSEVFASSLEAFRQMPGLAAALDSLPDPGESATAQRTAEESSPRPADRDSEREPQQGSEREPQQGSERDSEQDSDRPTDQVPGAGEPVGDALLPAADSVEALDLRSITVGWDATPVLDGLDLHAERGGWTLLCGDSGTGKSTSLSVLLRFLDPWAGSYTAYGTQGATVDMLTRAPADLVGRIAWCPQEAHIFRSTVRGNLALAQQRVPGEAEMLAALRAAGLNEWADAAGLNRWVGDHGSEVSGGQRQRLAVARTLLTGADVIVLDEPTAHLDDETANLLIDDLRRNLISHTVVMVTHDRRLITDDDIVVDLGERSSQQERPPQDLGAVSLASNRT